LKYNGVLCVLEVLARHMVEALRGCAAALFSSQGIRTKSGGRAKLGYRAKPRVSAKPGYSAKPGVSAKPGNSAKPGTETGGGEVRLDMYERGWAEGK
jgi:hypothetical protein